MLADDDPTIPDRLLLRSLIEDGLPARAAANHWPVLQPPEIARLIFDPIFRGPYELHVPEPFFENLAAAKVRPAVGIALGLMHADIERVRELLAASTALRA